MAGCEHEGGPIPAGEGEPQHEHHGSKPHHNIGLRRLREGRPAAGDERRCKPRRRAVARWVGAEMVGGDPAMGARARLRGVVNGGRGGFDFAQEQPELSEERLGRELGQ
nr:unnamed protein product [Digitaria exilis]